MQARAEWDKKLALAKAFMSARSAFSNVLIEIAAQHPLKDQRYPNEEFEARLRLGTDLYQSLRIDHSRVEIYVPGSRHMHNSVPDEVSLSAAGTDLLVEFGVPREDVRGDDLNDRYKGRSGVYSSADECFVTSKYFRDVDFGQLLSVVSPPQLIRKVLHYIEFGVLPLMHTAPVYDTYHDYISELFDQIPHVLLVDSSLQHPHSQRGQELRWERRPKL